MCQHKLAQLVLVRTYTISRKELVVCSNLITDMKTTSMGNL